jgi:hypothetical protein
MAGERERRTTLGEAVWGELVPYPGRLIGSLRDTLSIVIALVLAETLRENGISLALALIFLLQREHPGLTLRSALQLLGGAVVALVVALTWVQLTDGVEVARFVGVGLGVFCYAVSAVLYDLRVLWVSRSLGVGCASYAGRSGELAAGQCGFAGAGAGCVGGDGVCVCEPASGG